jgi:hypothetical protein
MRMRRALHSLAALALAVAAAFAPAFGADRYDGPRPPKQDVVYLMHADNLIPTEIIEAKQEGKKDEPVYTIPGAASTAKTPLAEPIFLLQSDLVDPERLELYKLDVKNGHREVTTGKKRRGKAFHLTVTKLDGRLYKIEADETLDDGEYSLSPTDSNKAFCFQVY